MKTLQIKGTKYSPMVKLNTKGEMIIAGRSIMEDPAEFYYPIIDTVQNYQSKKFTLEVRLEYLNTTSIKILLDLMIVIKEHFNPNDVRISWYYESDDEDILELGKDFESIISIPIDFFEMVEE